MTGQGPKGHPRCSKDLVGFESQHCWGGRLHASRNRAVRGYTRACCCTLRREVDADRRARRAARSAVRPMREACTIVADPSLPRTARSTIDAPLRSMQLLLTCVPSVAHRSTSTHPPVAPNASRVPHSSAATSDVRRHHTERGRSRR